MGPQAQSGMDASNLLKMISQLRSQGNPTPKKKSADSNNQAQMLMNQISQMNALNQPQTGANPMAALQMMTQLQALQGVKGKNAAPAQKGNVGVNDLVTALTGKQGREAGHCVWVTGLPEEYQDAQKLLNIFGNFGNVRRIVFADKKPDGALIQMDNANSAMKARFVTRNQTIGGKPFNVTQLDPVKFKRASIGTEDKKSMDVTKAKENWRFAKNSKFLKICMARLKQLSPRSLFPTYQKERKIWSRSTSLRLDIPLSLWKVANGMKLRNLDLLCKLSSWHLQKKQLVPSLTFIIHGQRKWVPRIKIISSVSVDLTLLLLEV